MQRMNPKEQPVEVNYPISAAQVLAMQAENDPEKAIRGYSHMEGDHPMPVFDIQLQQGKYLNQVQSLLEQHQQLFNEKLIPGGNKHFEPVQIKLKDETPSWTPGHFVSAGPQQKAATEIIHGLCQDGIMEEVKHARWNSPMIMVKEKLNPQTSKDYRLCIDFREINKKVIRERFTLPNTTELARRAAGRKYMSSLDLKHGFHQFPLHPNSMDYTSFCVPHLGKSFRFRTLPMGLSNSPEIFSKMLQQELSDIIDFERCFLYIDDILIATDTIEEHIELLTKLIKRLSKLNLKLSPNKCELCATSINYLGYVLNQHGIGVGTKKQNVIKSYPRPDTRKELQSFLGTCGYFRRLIRNFAAKTIALTDMVKSEATKLVWTPKAEEQFEKIKLELANLPLIAPLDTSKPLYLETDASGEAIGAVLLQDYQNTRRPVEFFSKKLSANEKKWTLNELETFALVAAVEKWSNLLRSVEGKKIAYTDSRTAVAAPRTDLSAKRGRWGAVLMDHDIELVYKPGRLNNVADALSRIPQMEKKQEQVLMQQESKEKAELTEQKRFVQPDAVQSVLHTAHQISGHQATDKMLFLLRDHKWPGKLEDVKDFVRNCDACQRASKRGPDTMAPQQSTLTSLRDRSHSYSCDEVGPFTKSHRSKVLTVVNMSTGYLELAAMKNSQVPTLIQTLDRILFSRFGSPKYLVMDGAKSHASKQFQGAMLERGTQVRLTTPGRAKGNGLAEIANRFVGEKVLAFHLEQPKLSLETVLSKVQFAWNATPNKTTGLSPHFLMFGQDARTALTEVESSTDWWHSYGEAVAKAEVKRDHVIKQRNDRANAATKKPPTFKIGDSVLYFNKDQKTGSIGHLTPKWLEAKVVAIHGNSLSLTKPNQRQTFIRNADQCKLYRKRFEDESSGRGEADVRSDTAHVLSYKEVTMLQHSV